MLVLVRSAALAAAILLALAAPAAAQGDPVPAVPITRGEVRGRVVNAAGTTPVAGATVDVTRADTAAASAMAPPAGRAAADADGTFRVQGLAPGRYRLRIRAIGFAPRTLPVVLGPSSPSVDLGTVTMTAAALELQAVTVTTQRREVQLAPDRNTYVVSDMPATRGGNALDVLRNVPSVDVDIDNVVSLRGNAGVVVQINGRPSPMKPGQLGNFLAQLPADMVERVEVIPNPSARDDPEGVAGIINIVLKQEADAGRSGGLTLTGGTTGRAEVGGNAGYEQGPLSLYGSYGFMRDSRPRTDAIFRENRFLEPVTYLEEAGLRTQIPVAHTLTGSAGYALGEHDELSTDLMFSTRNEAETYSLLYRDLDASRALAGLSDRQTRGINHEFNFESTLEYKHGFADKGHELTSELRAFRAGEGGPTSIAAHALSMDGAPPSTTTQERQVAWEHPDEYSLRADYVRPLSSFVRLETGYKGSLDHFHTTLDTRVMDTEQAAFVPDTARISDFTYDQLVHAAYGMLSAQRGRFQMQGGLRVERATTRFDLATRGTTYDNDYNSAFPSALVAWDVDDAHQVKLSYSTRIRRPDDTDQLDPTPRYADPLNVGRGNPYLQPEYIRALELGLQRTGERMTVQLTPFLRHTIDAVRTIRTIDSAGVATRTFANVATSDAYGTDLTVALTGSRLSGFAGASAFRQVSDAANLAPGLSARTFGWNARTNAAFRVSHTIDLQSLLSYQAPMTVEQGKIASRTRFSLAARQKLMDDRMSLTLRVIDPFNTSRESSTTIDPRFYQVSDRTRAIRGVLLSANWTFGDAKKKGPEKIDLEGGGGGAP